MPLCEACENRPANIVDPHDDEASPYRLRASCHGRLHTRALRPVEWYNLAKHHGCWQFLLHDDFYEQDGTADQPLCEVESPELFPAPTLDEVSNNPDTLLDFTITRWRFDESLANAWRAHLSTDNRGLGPPRRVLKVQLVASNEVAAAGPPIEPGGSRCIGTDNSDSNAPVAN